MRLTIQKGFLGYAKNIVRTGIHQHSRKTRLLCITIIIRSHPTYDQRRVEYEAMQAVSVLTTYDHVYYCQLSA